LLLSVFFLSFQQCGYTFLAAIFSALRDMLKLSFLQLLALVPYGIRWFRRQNSAISFTTVRFTVSSALKLSVTIETR
jgi:hypothetical protein